MWKTLEESESYILQGKRVYYIFKGMKCFLTQGDLFSLLGSLSNNNGKKVIGLY